MSVHRCYDNGKEFVSPIEHVGSSLPLTGKLAGEGLVATDGEGAKAGLGTSTGDGDA